jgi:hypothetical protein
MNRITPKRAMLWKVVIDIINLMVGSGGFDGKFEDGGRYDHK